MPWTVMSLWASDLLQCVSIPATRRTCHRGVSSILESSPTHCSLIFLRNRKMSFFAAELLRIGKWDYFCMKFTLPGQDVASRLSAQTHWQHRQQFESWMENTWGISWAWLAISIPSALSPCAKNDAAAPGLSPPQNYLLSSWQCWSCAYT